MQKKTPKFDVHGPFCPEDCSLGILLEDVLEIFEDQITREELESMKLDVGKHICDGCFTIYRVQ